MDRTALWTRATSKLMTRWTVIERTLGNVHLFRTSISCTCLFLRVKGMKPMPAYICWRVYVMDGLAVYYLAVQCFCYLQFYRSILMLFLCADGALLCDGCIQGPAWAPRAVCGLSLQWSSQVNVSGKQSWISRISQWLKALSHQVIGYNPGCWTSTWLLHHVIWLFNL